MAKKSERRGLQRLGRLISKITDPAIRKRGFVHTEIINRWAAIVGEELAEASVPQRISYPSRQGEPAMLQVRVDSARATELQHMTPLVIERVNTYFGYRAIGGMRLTQDEIRKAPTPKPGPEPGPTAPPSAAPNSGPAMEDERIAQTRDPALREALAALGQRLRGS
jgi:hypothetical protein